MKALLASLLLSGLSLASETMLTTVHQPLEGFGRGEIHLFKVACKDHYATSGMSKAGLITAPNLAPTNSPEGTSDINLASALGIKMGDHSDDGRKHVITVNCSSAKKPAVAKAPAVAFDFTEVFRASLECLRLTYSEELPNTTFSFTIPADLTELQKVADEFLKHDKTKPFFKSGE